MTKRPERRQIKSASASPTGIVRTDLELNATGNRVVVSPVSTGDVCVTIEVDDPEASVPMAEVFRIRVVEDHSKSTIRFTLGRKETDD